jgi:hypothetical protein
MNIFQNIRNTSKYINYIFSQLKEKVISLVQRESQYGYDVPNYCKYAVKESSNGRDSPHTTLIDGAILAKSPWVFRLYWRYICDWCAKTVRLTHNAIKGVITFVKSGSKVIAYLYRRMRDGGIDRLPIPAPTPISLDELPDDIRKALEDQKEVLVNDDVSRPIKFKA